MESTRRRQEEEEEQKTVNESKRAGMRYDAYNVITSSGHSMHSTQHKA